MDWVVVGGRQAGGRRRGSRESEDRSGESGSFGVRGESSWTLLSPLARRSGIVSRSGIRVIASLWDCAAVYEVARERESVRKEKRVERRGGCRDMKSQLTFNRAQSFECLSYSRVPGIKANSAEDVR